MAVILLAEDDAAERGLIARGLAADGHAVIEAENGQIALQRVLADPAITLLITDIEMPELDGIELARRAMTERPDLKVLLTSGFAGTIARASDVLAKGARNLPKPVQLERIRAEVRSMLG